MSTPRRARPGGGEAIGVPSGAENGCRCRSEASGCLSVVLPYPPGVNKLYRVYQGRSIKSAVCREYHAGVAAAVWYHQRYRHADLGPPMRLVIDLYPPDARRRDVDGPVKCLMDAVFAGLGVDDSAVKVLHVEMHAPDRANPRAEVLIENLEVA